MPPQPNTPTSEQLLEVIRTQTEISKASLNLPGVMELVTRRAHQLVPSHGAILEIAEGDEMVYRAATGTAEKFLGLRLARGNSLSGLCVQTGEPVLSPDTETDPRVDREACRRIGIRSMIVVPLQHSNRTVGVLKLYSGLPQAFGARDVEILRMLSDMIAAAMVHASEFMNKDEEARTLFERATRDYLTKLDNRAMLQDKLRSLIAVSKREKKKFGVLALDMNGLKTINDTHGHAAGDAALCEVASRLRVSVRASDAVARLGGDEFVILLGNVADAETARTVIEKIHAALAVPFSLHGTNINLRASIGLAMFPDDGADEATLLEKADQEMYRVKGASRR